MYNDLSNSLLHQFHRASQLSDELFGTEAAGLKITPRQYVVLATVEANQGLSQTDIVNMTGIDRSTLADVVRRLIEHGFLSRQRTKDDARAYAVSITPEGRQALMRAAESARKADEALLAKLSDADGHAFKQSLTAILSD